MAPSVPRGGKGVSTFLEVRNDECSGEVIFKRREVSFARLNFAGASGVVVKRVERSRKTAGRGIRKPGPDHQHLVNSSFINI